MQTDILLAKHSRSVLGSMLATSTVSVPKMVTGRTPFFLQLNAFGSLQNLMSMATWIAHSSGTPPPSLSRLPPHSSYSLHSPSKPPQSMSHLSGMPFGWQSLSQNLSATLLSTELPAASSK